MSVDALALGLIAIDDEGRRTAVAAGDLSTLDDSDLSEEEASLLTAAAQEDVEVDGFALAESAYFRAVDYVRINQNALSVEVRPVFAANIQMRFANFGGSSANCQSWCTRTT